MEKLLSLYANQDYEAKNGTTPESTSYEFSDDNANAIVTLTDENGDVLDVYTVNISTGISTNQKGEEVDLSAYAKEPNYFMPSDYMDDVAEIYYFEQTGIRASGKGILTDTIDNVVKITVYDDNGGTLEVYTINAETGIGANSKGNAVDFSVYADYKSLEESDYFLPMDTIFDIARTYFTKTTGTEPEGGMEITEKPSFQHEVEITFHTEDGTVLEAYTIVAETGMQTKFFWKNLTFSCPPLL